MTDLEPGHDRGEDRIGYLLQELRCASLRAKLWQHDIEAIGLALKGGLVTPEQALEMLRDCDCLQIVGTQKEAA